MSKLKQSQIEEWFESEVTQHLLSIMRRRLSHIYELRAGTYFPGEPNKTQETKAMFLGAEGELCDLIEAFDEKDLSTLEDEETEHAAHIRDASEGRSSSH